jgi:hypothetical protein
MIDRVKALRDDERGQTLVFFVLGFTALFAVAAIVINLGNVLVTRERTQAVADSAVLAGSQEQPDVFAVQNTEQNYISAYPNTTITGNGTLIDGTTRERLLEATHTPTGLFHDLLASLGINIDALTTPITVRAYARSEVPLTLNNISPLAIHCDLNCQSDVATGGNPSAWPPDGSTSVTFNYVAGDTVSSDFGPIQLPGVSSESDFANFMPCDPLNTSANCNANNADSTRTTETSCVACAPPWYSRLNFGLGMHGNAVALQNDLSAAEGTPHLVAVYDTAFLDSGFTTHYHLIGWAYFQIDSVNTGSDDFQITGTFHKLNVDGSYVSGGTVLQDGGNDFGVRAVALSK